MNGGEDVEAGGAGPGSKDAEARGDAQSGILIVQSYNLNM